MVNVDVHGPVQGADQGGLVGTQTLVSSVDGLCLPVGPVDVLLEQSHGKDVGDVLAENCEGPHTINKSINHIVFAEITEPFTLNISFLEF